MTTTHHPRPGHPDENLGEFAEELRLLAEAVLERVEPVLRRTASDGRTEWSSCSWCPVCAAAAIVRGEHHDVVAAIAEHGTAIVTVLREALAGVPVDPVIPPDLDPESPEYQAWHHFSHVAETGFGAGDLPFADAAARGDGGPDGGSEFPRGGGQSGDPHGAAGLAAVFARFLAGAQGRAAARNRSQAHPDAGSPDDPFGPGPGAARRPGDSDPGGSDTVPHNDFRMDSADDRVAGDQPAPDRPFGVAHPGAEPGPAGFVGQPAPARDSGPAAGRGGAQPGGGRRAERAKYVPIDVTIKA
ncbi:hypothetical protein ACIRRA_18250 [Nocardia sp. NPDC101769]|uniref:hypothetical protein n=1 Tax=Nocardia sp. NPDC101769 TaxID=3364333 RepID=UPI0038070C04